MYGDFPPGDIAPQPFKLNFQPQSANGKVILPKGMIILALPQSGQEQPVDSVIYTGKLANGVSLRDQWKLIQPNNHTWNWSYFDSEVANAQAAGKSVMLRINTQDGSCPGWVKNQVTNVIDTNSGTQVQLWWDPTYIALSQALWQAAAARYANVPCVKYIAMNPPSTGGGDWQVPYQNAGNWKTTTNWNIPAVGSTVNLLPAAGNPPIYQGSYVLVQGTAGYMGWFYVFNVNGSSNAPTSIDIQNQGTPAYAPTPNAAPGTSVPSSMGLSQNMIFNWTQVYGYTTQNLLGGIMAVADTQFKAFPRQHFSMSFGTNGGLDTAVNPAYTNQTAAQMIANACYTKYGSRFSMAKNGMKANTPWPNANAGTIWEIFNLCPYINREAQFFWWSAGDPTYLNNGGVPADPVLVLQQSAQIAAAYGVSRLEYYMQDVELLQSCNIVFRQMPLIAQSRTSFTPRTIGYLGPNKIGV